MMPMKGDDRWTKLAKGEIKHEFKCLPAGLMVSRIRRKLERDSSPAAMQSYANEIHSFFEKYESILQDDIKHIF